MSTIPSSPSTISTTATSAWDYGTLNATASATPTVASGATLGQAQSASSIALDAGVVATLGGSTAGSTYTATGLLDSFVNAGTLASAGDSTTGTTASGSVDVNAQWASVLKSNPGYSTNVAADMVAQGIVATLSVSA